MIDNEPAFSATAANSVESLFGSVTINLGWLLMVASVGLGAFEMRLTGKFFNQCEAEGQQTSHMQGSRFCNGVSWQPGRLALAENGQFASGQEENPFSKA